MRIQVNTDNFIDGHADIIATIKDTVESDLGHMTDRLTRVEVHLKDQNAERNGPDDILCTIEARPRGLDPMAADSNGADVMSALRGATRKLRARLSSEFGKIDSHR